jgi:hypothetical protein
LEVFRPETVAGSQFSALSAGGRVHKNSPGEHVAFRGIGVVKIDRRNILRAALGGGAGAPLVLPEQWSKPVVKALIVPAHAISSPAATTTLPPI